MCKLTAVMLVAAIGVVLLAASESGSGQAMPASELAAGKGLRDAPQQFIKAFQSGNHDGMFSQMASWLQDGAALQKEKFDKTLASGKMTDEKLQKLIARIDPKGTLKLKDAESLRALSPSQYFALQARFVAAHSLRDANNQKLQWYEVERAVGLVEPNSREERIRNRVMGWGGMSAWENSAGETLVFHLAIDDNRWAVSAVDLKLSTGRASSTLLTGGTVDIRAVGEGEQLLGSARDYSRVQYSKTGTSPGNIYDFTDKDTFTGAYYVVEGEIYELTVGGEQRYNAAIVAKPIHDDGPWLTIRFQWASGQSKIERHDDEDAMKAALKNWQ